MKTIYTESMEALTAAKAVSSENSQYDRSYSKEQEATITGVFFFLIPVMFVIFCIKYVDAFHDNTLFMETILGGGLIMRLVASVYVAKVAADQNRRSANWVILSFLAPGSALMIIGQMKKFNDSYEQRKHSYSHHNHDSSQPSLQMAN